MSATASSCSKCQKELENDALDAELCPSCSSALAASSTAALDATPIEAQPKEEEARTTEGETVKMEVENEMETQTEMETDLTTNETLDELDELDKRETKEEQLQQQSQIQAEDIATPSAAIAPTVRMTPTQQRVGKMTRSSLNGQRSPTVIKRLRKSTRSTRFKAKLTGRNPNSNSSAAAASSSNGQQQHSGQSSLPTGAAAGNRATQRNRRSLFKRPTQQQQQRTSTSNTALRLQAATRFAKSVFYKGSYMQIGDIVSLVDSEQRVFYAQIRGLLIDAYCEKSAFLTWLIPTQDSPDPQEGFDPATYLIGPDEQLSRKLCFLQFIMHAPSNYYFDRTTPFPLPDIDDYTTHRSGGFIWTRLPIVRRERERKAAA